MVGGDNLLRTVVSLAVTPIFKRHHGAFLLIDTRLETKINGHCNLNSRLQSYLWEVSSLRILYQPPSLEDDSLQLYRCPRPFLIASPILWTHTYVSSRDMCLGQICLSLRFGTRSNFAATHSLLAMIGSIRSSVSSSRFSNMSSVCFNG